MPLRELTAPDASASQRFGAIGAVRQMSDGRVLVNDTQHRQLVMLDASMKNATVSLDSVSTGEWNYGRRASVLLPYLGDSSLFVDWSSNALVVVDDRGHVVRSKAQLPIFELIALSRPGTGVDTKGNLVYQRTVPRLVNGTRITVEDSQPVVRVDFARKTTTQLGVVRWEISGSTSTRTDAGGRPVVVVRVNPLPIVDEFAVLADGSVAFVRSADYHVDLIQPNGRMIASSNLPYEWIPLSPAARQALIDSARAAQAQASASGDVTREAIGAGLTTVRDSLVKAGILNRTSDGELALTVTRDSGGATRASGVVTTAAGNAGVSMQMPVGPYDLQFPPVAEMADHVPPFRVGAARGDADGNLWIQRTGGATGGALYDVVDNRAVLVSRVRVPAGREIAGFGKGGVVYLKYADGARGWVIERVRMR